MHALTSEEHVAPLVLKNGKETVASPRKPAMKFPAPEGKPVQIINLGSLDFDIKNPRFGAEVGARSDQRAVLNHLVSTFGVDDVLSSIAVNGYFVAEPMICRREGERYVVVEGNRRLAACLIIAGDPRAQDQKRLTAQASSLRGDRPTLTGAACIVFEPEESGKELLAYLGVRHIAASQGWDSYAKAAWIARAVEEHQISLSEIAAMTGDQHKTVNHLLEGHYFIKQLVASGYFDPKSSQRKGRGSNPEFPFSWIYTLFFTQAAREFVGLPETPTPDPIPKEHLQRAGMLLERMFGVPNKPAAISDSRDITRLARTLDDSKKVALLEAGRNIDQIEFESQPLEDKLRVGLQQCSDRLVVLLAAIESGTLERGQASRTEPQALAVAHLAQSIYKKLREASLASGLEDLPPQS